MNVKKELEENKTVLLVIPNDNYNKYLMDFIKGIGDKRVCYVSLNKGYSALIELFKKNEINYDNFFFIDCITSTITREKPEGPNCIYISSPHSLTEMSIAIGKCGEFDVIVVDSLSTLLVYHKINTLTRFANSLINKTMINAKAFLVLTISDRDKGNDLFKGVSTFVGKVLYSE